jgi:hypothetical protein
MKELRAGNPLVAGAVTIVPIECCSLHFVSWNMGCCLSGLKEPFAIIVRDADGVRAFDTEGSEISLQSLVRKIPDLEVLLA